MIWMVVSWKGQKIHESILKKVTNSDFGWEKWGDSNCPTTEVVPRFPTKKTTFPRGIGPPPMKGAALGPPWQSHGSGAKCQVAAAGLVEVIGPTNYHGTWNKPLGWTHGSDRKWLGSAGVFSPTYGTYKQPTKNRGELTQLLSTSRTSRHGSGKYISYTWAIQKKILKLNWFGHLDRIPNAESYILRWPTGGNRSL